MPCLVPGLHMKFPSLSVTDAWVTMQLHSSRKKQTRYNFVLQLMEQLKSVQQLSYFDCMFFFFHLIMDMRACMTCIYYR